ncbi:unnamed protein product [Thelazia callipaeda]|uniref:RBR-type E3 ubiquitin transferase n=1 Tax=Thelazia callipaeda TaxID=103827 RepID=A0A0N5CJD8_THECL|nr:unnamed protein product [Thelazia callipaeda]
MATDGIKITDSEDQVNEIEALQSVYCTEMESFKYDAVSKLFYRNRIVALPSQLLNVSNLYSKDVLDDQNINIFYLPPIFLHITLPQNYPSTCMPQFSLDIYWLDSTAKNHLAKVLLNAWETYCGMPILFMWIDLLKEEILKILQTRKVINLNELIEKEKNEDAIEKNPLDLLREIAEQNELGMKSDFESRWFNCKVCFSYKKGNECLKFDPCGHIFCSGCVSNYYRQKLADNMMRDLKCLSNECDSPATQKQIREVLTDQEFENYDRRLFEAALDLMSDVVRCPRIWCQNPVVVDGLGTSNLATCSICYFSFCILCKKAYHGLDPCHINKGTRGELLNELKSATPAQLNEIAKRFGGKKQMQKMIDSLKSEEWIEDNSKSCPSCHANIEKKDGCNKITCAKCGQSFCWLCRSILNKNDPYVHFNISESNCFNRLFEGMNGIDDDWLFSDSDQEDHA